MAKSSQDTWTVEDGLTAIHDPVPGSAGSGIYGGSCRSPHDLERDIQRVLLNLPEMQFSSLRVHRVLDGICLTGVVKVPPGPKPRFDRMVTRVTGITKVLDHLVVQSAECSVSR